MKLSGRGESVLIALGGNQGDRLAQLQGGVRAVHALEGVEVLAGSSVFETEFIGPGRQPDFLNACLEARCEVAPEQLLTALQAIEEQAGRCPDTHLQPRPLDLDILLFGERVVHTRRLTVPHPRMRERAFVLMPLAEIAGTRKFPDSGETVAEACARIEGRGQEIRRFSGRLG